MFTSFPGFEELPLQVEVEHQGRSRWVVARLEQVPDAPILATLVCSFADAPQKSQWLLDRTSIAIYTVGNPSKYLRLDEEGRKQWQPDRVQKLIRLVQHPFGEKSWGITRLRAVELPDLPCTPRIALLRVNKVNAAWLHSWTNEPGSTPFAVPQFDLEVDDATIRQWIEEQWNDVTSEVRFAWEWANWIHAERARRVFACEGDFAEIKQIMRWILISSPQLWETNPEWVWMLRWQIEEHGQLHGYSGSYGSNSSLIDWQKWLWNHFFNGFHDDWAKQHTCVSDFLRRHFSPSVVVVEVRGIPTLHEQLEARLSLRDWLQKNAPDRMDLLDS